MGNLSSRVADIRGHYTNNFDLSLFKEFHPVREWMKLQFRAEALNAFNRVQFASPNTSVTSSSFGRVTNAGEYAAAGAVRVEADVAGPSVARMVRSGGLTSQLRRVLRRR
jgi:hypothetical protein